MMQLRKVTTQDIDILYQWANDVEVRRNAFSTDPIEYSSHVKWFESKLNSSNCEMYILVKDNTPIGQIRLDYCGNLAYIDYSIQKDFRNQGYGSLILNLVEDKIIDNKYDNIVLVALVKKHNLASCERFIQNGYDTTEYSDYFEFRKKLNKG